jgi:hypothetical protein
MRNAFLFFCFLMALPIHAQAPPAAQADSRHKLVVCVQNATTKVAITYGLTPPGAAYLVGLACSQERAVYQKDLIQAGGFDVPKLMQFVDMQIVDYVLGKMRSQANM